MIFLGITENYNRSCESLILRFMADEMRKAQGAWSLIEPTDLVLYAEILVEQTRPIIVRFRDYRYVDHVMDNSYKLRGSKFSVDRDCP